MKKVKFIGNGCEVAFGKAREIVAGNPEIEEIDKLEDADIVVVNYCAMTSDETKGWSRLHAKIARAKAANPNLIVIGGGCITDLFEPAIFDCRDVIFVKDGFEAALPNPPSEEQLGDFCFHRGEVADVFAKALSSIDVDTVERAPYVYGGIANIVIESGCNRRCSFCKANYLKNMKVRSTPEAEVIGLVCQALDQGVTNIALNAENSTEYGIDIGTNLVTLLRRLLEFDKLRHLDVYGLCLDEVDDELLEVLKHPKIRHLQLEVQSLNDTIRKKMRLNKTTEEVLTILNTLKDKPIVSNLMIGFPGHSMNEFNREMKLIQRNHLYYLTYNDYCDTPCTPSSKMYQPLPDDLQSFYLHSFMKTVGEERRLLTEKLMQLDSIEACVVGRHRSIWILDATNYQMQVFVKRGQARKKLASHDAMQAAGQDGRGSVGTSGAMRDSGRDLKPGDEVRVKIIGLFDVLQDVIDVTAGKNVSPATNFMTSVKRAQSDGALDYTRYFNGFEALQTLPLVGEIVTG